MTNEFDEAFQELSSIHALEEDAPQAPGGLPAYGDFHVLELALDRPVAISTLASTALADRIAEEMPGAISIVGKTETENIGIEKIVRNVLATPSIRFLIVCGQESAGHGSGSTLLALKERGVNAKMRVQGAKGRKPILANLSLDEVETFRSRIEMIDMIECEDERMIIQSAQDLAKEAGILEEQEAIFAPEVEQVVAIAKDPKTVKLDKQGYFVIMVKPEHNTLIVEHYANDNRLLRAIHGNNARDLYWTILDNAWISEISHAAYLGKELTLAELSLKTGVVYVQDKA